MGNEKDRETKEEINQLLWTFLPKETTLEQAENIACKMYDLIRDEYDRVGSTIGPES